jgi:hypothetical protein
VNVIDNEVWYNTIMIGDSTRSPGIVRITGHDRKIDWDKKPANGTQGATSTLKGIPLGGFQAEFTLSTPEEQEAWPAFQRLLESSYNGPAPKALPIYHPDLAENRYTDVVVENIGGQRDDGLGGKLVAVVFGEHRPPQPKPAKKAEPNDSDLPLLINKVHPVPKPGPNQTAKDELAGLLDQARAP